MDPFSTLIRPPIVWAQNVPDELEMPLLALRRWCWGQTLSSPRSVPGAEGLWGLMIGLAVLLLVAMVAQGPVRALGQVFNLAAHVRLIGAAVERLRASARLVMILLGASVVCWTTALMMRYNRPSGAADLTLLLRTRSVPEAAAEQAMLSTLTPLRDLFSLSDLLVLLALAGFVTFRNAADRWGTEDRDFPESKGTTGRTTLAWVVAALYGIYRLLVLVATPGDLPIAGGLYIEPVVVPTLMLLSDALLVSWVLVELRRAERSSDVEPVEVSAAISLWPAAILACLVVMPARYAATMAYLSLNYVTPGVARTVLGPLIGGWGIVSLQAAALVVVGIAGVAPWCGGGWRSTLKGYARLLRGEGGHLVGALAIGGVLAGLLAGLGYLLLLSLPTQPWVLPAADSYAHYATLAVGLGLLAALVELGSRTRVAPERKESEPSLEAVGSSS